METKTISLREDVYEQLEARKREDESVSDLVLRLLEETTVNSREWSGALPDNEADELEQIVESSRSQTSTGLSTRQREALAEPAETDDETT
ncbi:hypothetical protein C482_17813 [Natrialba chahannaoensis JCM 10990]|uniref:CopG family transcriptional regulator n=1 Tax=Natrialba chahannaoensis JCM 10990 TaxID=1227492 RepID=M0A8V3_9EURY|nr:antitoxin VapB family protein [Natrialba chahannaoensis]ELY94954.1 hypothetical protein C482_17813 [Natrialba chahannaoensis JCM 10990]